MVINWDKLFGLESKEAKVSLLGCWETSVFEDVGKGSVGEWGATDVANCCLYLESEATILWWALMVLTSAWQEGENTMAAI